MSEEKDIAIKEETRAIAPLSEKTITDYLAAFGLADTLTKQEQMQFVEVAKAFNLNPFKREIYCVPYKDGNNRKLSIIIGYETYLKRADTIPAFNGFETKLEGRFVPGKINKKGQNGNYQVDALVPDGPVFCECIVYRKDRSIPTRVKIDFNEYNQHNRMWETKPRTMLEKVAIAQAFRKAFPNEMGGMPYTSEELPDEMTNVRDVTPQKQEYQEITLPTCEADKSEAAKATEEANRQNPGAAKVKPTAEQVEKLNSLKTSFTDQELAQFKIQYHGDPAGMIDAMTKARIAKLEAGTLRQEDEFDDKFKWATPAQREEYRKMLQEEGQTTVGEPAPPLEFGEDDSKELYD